MDDHDAESPAENAVTLSPRESDAWAWGLLDAMRDAVVVTDGKRRVRGWNRRAMLLYGYDQESTVGQDLLLVPPFEGATGLAPLVEEQLAADTPAEFTYGVDGRGVQVRALPPHDPRVVDPHAVAGGGLIVTIRDEAPGREDEEAHALRSRIERGRALFDTMLQQLAIGLVIAEAPTGRLLMHNNEAKSSLGRTALPSMRDAVESGAGAEHPDGTPYGTGELPLARALRGEVVRHEDMVYRSADGTPLRFSVNAAPVRDEDGTILFAVAAFEDVTERTAREAALRSNEEQLARLNERLLYEALHDVLTTLPNRTLLLDRLEQVLRRRLQDPERDAALLFLDFDRFKIVNDSLGHAVGDAMLVAIARILRQVVRPEDTVARLGGDEFVILMDHVDAVERSVDLANRIQAAFEKPIDVGNHLIYTSASIGIVPSMIGYDDAQAVLRDADTAMYRAKASGGGDHQVFDQSMRDRVVATMELETALRKALAGDELRVRYGPIHRLDTRAVVGFEALVRWQHPQRGLLTADQFISVASEMGIVRQIDQGVWREANRTVTAWRDRFDRPLLLSLNFSRQHFLSPDPEKALLDILEETGAEPDQTVVELTAGTLSDVSGKVATSILKLVASGISLHLDDFGTAQTSLVSLQGFHVAALKLDPSLVERMMDDEKCMELVRTIFAMADSLDLDVIAKGIDTEAQCARLLELGCTYAQGSLFSPPVDEEGAIQLLQAHDHDAEGVESSDA